MTFPPLVWNSFGLPGPPPLPQTEKHGIVFESLTKGQFHCPPPSSRRCCFFCNLKELTVLFRQKKTMPNKKAKKKTTTKKKKNRKKQHKCTKTPKEIRLSFPSSLTPKKHHRSKKNNKKHPLPPHPTPPPPPNDRCHPTSSPYFLHVTSLLLPLPFSPTNQPPPPNTVIPLNFLPPPSQRLFDRARLPDALFLIQ